MKSNEKIWKVSKKIDQNNTEAKELLEFGDITSQLLWNRGIRNKKEAINFIEIKYEEGLHDPFLLKDSEKASKRIIDAIKNGEKIAIYSDYDADGIPGAVIFNSFLIQAGVLIEKLEVYIPHRDEEGFGFHSHAVSKLKDEGVNLIITIDCGMVDFQTALKAKELGIDVIITDHHLPKDGKLPQVFAVVNPKQEGCSYPYKGLCGAGVAFKLIQAILKIDRLNISDGLEKWLLDMVAIATFGDMVPLTGENRVLTHFGLKVMRKSRRKGFRKMLLLAKVDQNFLSEEDVGFIVIPRINSASRVGESKKAFALLASDNESDSTVLAKYLEEKNSERKLITAHISKSARKMVEEKISLTGKQEVLVLGNPDWKPGYLGPVANNLSEEYSVPVFLWGRTPSGIKGSCRAPQGANVVSIMSSVSSGVLKEFGGHALSGGFSVVEEKIYLFEDELKKAYKIFLKSGDSNQKNLDVSSDLKEEFSDESKFYEEFHLADMELGIDDINEEVVKQIERLAPFGMENPKPIFIFRKLKIDNSKMFGKSMEHLELSFKNSDQKNIRAIKFFFNKNKKIEENGVEVNSEDIASFLRGKTIDLVASIEKSYFRSKPELRLRIIDIIPLVNL